MRRLSRMQKILISLISFFLVLSCLMLSLRQNTISDLGYSAWTYIRYGLFESPATSVSNALTDFSNLWHAYQDNVYLNEQLANQRSYQTLYAQEHNRNLELQGLLELKNSMPEATQISAQVLARPGQTWNQTFTVSAGSASGVEEGMAVASAYGLVGMVSEVQTNTSTVTLLTSNELPNDFAIQISMDDGSTVEGVFQGYDAAANRYEIRLFDHEAVVLPGQKVATSGKGGVYASGLMVGTVTGTVMNDDAVVSTVYASPVEDISGFSYVNIFSKGTPAP
ncbi:rod shape-determining protein MreC [Erysipelotrichaceae bacterium 51-3]|uniref:rod shape-determining protein MreC n=1 Tax=Allobaculum sp. JKK-2023 TaxID=3108943 RepID=UPI002B05553D|nr:rod shape-determining protein MreC [Allobaculum sp. JKK-2023]